MTLRTKGKAIVLLAVYGTAFVFALLAYFSYRDSNVSTIAVSKLSDFDREFEVGDSTLRVRNPDVLRVCFVGEYVRALRDARQWFAKDETEFKTALRAAGGRADTFNGSGKSSIVLLSHTSAIILQLDWRTVHLENLGCANARDGDIALRQSKFSAELYLPNATLKAPRGPGQPRATPCEEKLQRFVETIDDLLAENESEAHFDAAIKKYFPQTGCTAEEVISISRTSRFFEARQQAAPSRRVFDFRNSITSVVLVLHEDTGTIFPDVWPTVPSL